MHCFEDLFILHFDLYADFFAFFSQKFLYFAQGSFAVFHISDQDHVKEAIQNILVKVQYIDAMLSQNARNFRDNTYSVLSNNGYNNFHLSLSFIDDLWIQR
jgi:hypothetical protein